MPVLLIDTHSTHDDVLKGNKSGNTNNTPMITLRSFDWRVNNNNNNNNKVFI